MQASVFQKRLSFQDSEEVFPAANIFHTHRIVFVHPQQMYRRVEFHVLLCRHAQSLGDFVALSLAKVLRVHLFVSSTGALSWD